jgi:hypothetical protein
MEMKKLTDSEIEPAQKERQMKVLPGKRLLSSGTLKDIFGAKSQIYPATINELSTFWKAVENVKQKYNSWQKSMEIVYGEPPEKNLLLTHTYLATLVKLVMYLRFERDLTDRGKLKSVINGEYFSSNGIIIFSEKDFSTWILYDSTNNTIKMVYAPGSVFMSMLKKTVDSTWKKF